MHVGTCTIHLTLHGVHSLKGKRRILKSVLTRVARQYNVAVAEIDHQDVWQTAVICLVTVGNDSGKVHSVLEHAVAWIQRQRPDIPIDDYYIELI
jgi:uncharacterized protein YlxP (DUF503 family)